MQSIVLITDVNFWDIGAGHRARISELVRYLAKKTELTVIATGPLFHINKEEIELHYKIKFIVLERNKILSSSGYLRKCKKELQNKHFDVAIIEYIHSSYFLSLFREGTKLILDAHDIISDRTNDFIKYNFQGESYEMTEEIEYQIFEFYDKIIVLCEPDLVKLRHRFPSEKVLLCPHPPILKKNVIRNYVTTISFVGSSYLPNKDGINHFIHSCWPQIAEKYNNITLSIFGTVCSCLKPTDNMQIRLNGVVKNLDDIYEQSDIIINPVRFGAGLKIKSVEALANGLPLVATTHAARGLEKLKDNGLLIADSPTEFCSAITNLIENLELRHSLAKKGQKYIKEILSPENCFSPLMNAIEQ